MRKLYEREPMLVVCEPECIGDAHEEVNSAFLLEFSELIPDERIVFFGDESHLIHVKRNLERKGLFAANLELRPGKIPSHPITGFRKYYEYYEYLKEIFDFTQSNQVRRIIFLSTNGYNLRAIKRLLRDTDASCICVLHGFLERLLEERPLSQRIKIWQSLPERYFQFKSQLFENNRNVTYVVLSPIIRDRLISLYPALAPNVEAVHHPYLFENVAPHIPFKDGKLRLGTSGSLFESKGLGNLERLISDLLSSNQLKKHLEVIIIGSAALRGNYPPNVKASSPSKRLQRDEMYQLAKDVDYFLFLYPEQSYQLMASGAYFDTLSYAKPVLALKNSFLSYYFGLMGNVGFLFNRYEELRQHVLNTISSLPVEEWNRQRSTIIDGRDRLMTHNRSVLSKILAS